ncbi:MAG: PQQ-dependent sugar dehydrogenase [Myxococcaceae bacterium]
MLKFETGAAGQLLGHYAKRRLRLRCRNGVLAVSLALGLAAYPQNVQGSGDAKRGASLFAQQCQLCHAPSGQTGGGQGPGLQGVLGRRAGSGPFSYSRALSRGDFVWDPALLDSFLAGPSRLVPGTSMSLHVDAAADRRDLIAYLATLRGGADEKLPNISPVSPPEPRVTAGPSGGLLAGAAAFGDWSSDAPGVRRHIQVSDLPAPFATPSAGNRPRVVDRPPGVTPSAPPGFRVTLFASGLENPRLIRVAPNGDLFVAESASGRIRVFRAPNGATQAAQNEVYAAGLDGPFGIAFYPPGPSPEWVYVANHNSVLRFPYRSGDLRARGAADTVVPRLAGTNGGHSTRDIVFSPDGTQMFVSVGSESNVADGIGTRGTEAIRTWEAAHGLGAAWGDEEGRADVLVFTPDGKSGRTFATGLRNCVGMAIQPATGALWCSTNERDGLGDDLVPDYITRVRDGAFFGWPWYYLGNHEEPRLKGQRPDLAGRATVPDVLLQAHSASLEMTFYVAAAFPPAFRGAFAAEHGSWNRAKRTGYKIIRIVLDPSGEPTGEYEDFLTGFVVSDSAVWGRPVGVAVAHDGALLVSEDANGTIWRVAYVAADVQALRPN